MAQLRSGQADEQASLERFMRALIEGERTGCADVVAEALAAGTSPREALERIAWPAWQILDGLSRRDRIGSASIHGATILLAKTVERIGARLGASPPSGGVRPRAVLVFSGPAPLEELAANMFVLAAEADGLAPRFLGGGVESDELFAEIALRRPDAVVGYAVAAADGPRIRRLLRMLDEHRPVAGLRIGGGGGLLARVEGLGEAMGLHFGGESPFDLLEALLADLSRNGAGEQHRPEPAAPRGPCHGRAA